MEASMIRRHMICRLQYLRNWEIVNIFFLPACLYSILIRFDIQNSQPYIFSMSIICLILAQGAFYWHLKLQAIYRKRPALPPYFQRVFTLFKLMNVALLSIYILLMIYGRITQGINFMPSFWSTALFLFAVLEYVNSVNHESYKEDPKTGVRA